jgi:serine/threonine-protein kinase
MALLIGELARGTLTRSPAEGVYQGLAWAPDGKRVAAGFVAEEETYSFRPRWFGADGSTPLDPFVIDAGPNLQMLPASFSPDGSVLLLVGFEYARTGPSDTSSDIYVLPLSGAKKRYAFLQTRFYETNARFSPDGRWVAYRSNESGRHEVFVRPFPVPGAKWQISAEGGSGPRWSLSGRELFYRNGDKTMAVDVETQPAFRAGRPRLLFESPYLWSYDVAADGSRFLMIRRDPAESGPPRVNVVLNWFEDVKRRVPGAK